MDSTTSVLLKKSKRISKNRRSKYSNITDETRQKLVDLVVKQGRNLKEATDEVGVHISTARGILRVYHDEGRIGKKKIRVKREKKQEEKADEDISTNLRCSLPPPVWNMPLNQCSLLGNNTLQSVNLRPSNMLFPPTFFQHDIASTQQQLFQQKSMFGYQNMYGFVRQAMPPALNFGFLHARPGLLPVSNCSTSPFIFPHLNKTT
eukprot:TRINITY_DN22010_c0_g1_i1.p1 TRINITY_DN22010_c0_g1~~TRINITY_DN22010_c0_g1_i1.p1  ORF type:complete len:205 (+),score=19.03 TRINITY_DN22010_c0_g1_i1:67-681(+)